MIFYNEINYDFPFLYTYFIKSVSLLPFDCFHPYRGKLSKKIGCAGQQGWAQFCCLGALLTIFRKLYFSPSCEWRVNVNWISRLS